MNELICGAIRNKLHLEFIYDDCYRVVMPHTFGKARTGKILLSAYQVNGESNTIEVPDWGLFEKKKIKDIKVIQSGFASAHADYNPSWDLFVDIYCQL